MRNLTASVYFNRRGMTPKTSIVHDTEMKVRIHGITSQMNIFRYLAVRDHAGRTGCSLASHRDLLAYVFSLFSTCFKYRSSISIYPRLQLTTCDNVEVGVSTLRKVENT